MANKSSKKFTFKKEIPTGRYRSFYETTTTIKQNGKVVGTIDEKFRIRLIVRKTVDSEHIDNENCDWEWITMKKQNESDADARLWLNDNRDAIRARWEIVELD